MIKTRAEAEAHQRKLADKGHIKLPAFLVDEGDKLTMTAAFGETNVKHTVRRSRKKTVPEKEMELILETQKRNGEILEFRFEGMRLKWGVDPDTGEAMWYKPDFVVTEPPIVIREENDNGSSLEIERQPKMKLIEVKGPWISERDIVRFKGCRAAWPMLDFEMHQRDKDGRWTRIQ